MEGEPGVPAVEEGPLVGVRVLPREKAAAPIRIQS